MKYNPSIGYVNVLPSGETFRLEWAGSSGYYSPTDNRREAANALYIAERRPSSGDEEFNVWQRT